MGIAATGSCVLEAEVGEELRLALVALGDFYVWKSPEVEAACRKLYESVADACDPDAFVACRIKTTIFRYDHSFNQFGFLAKLAS